MTTSPHSKRSHVFEGYAWQPEDNHSDRPNKYHCFDAVDDDSSSRDESVGSNQSTVIIVPPYPLSLTPRQSSSSCSSLSPEIDMADEETYSPWSSLQVHIVPIVLGYLNTHDLISARHVSKIFRQASYQAAVWQHATIVIENDSFINTKRLQPPNDDKLHLHEHCLQRLHTLGTVRHLEVMTNEGAESAIATAGVQQSLHTLCIHYTHPLYTAVPYYMPHLQHLSFVSPNWRSISSLRLPQQLQHLPHLQSLAITYMNGFDCTTADVDVYKAMAATVQLNITCDYRTPTFYQQLSQITNLTSLTLNSSKWKQTVDDNIATLQSLPSLHSLTLNGSTSSVEQATLIADRLGKLEQLQSVTFGFQITETNRRPFLRALQLLPDLKHLALLGGVSQDVQWLQTISYLRLESLTLQYISSLVHDAWIDLLEIRTLNRVSITECHLPDKTMLNMPTDIETIILQNVKISFEHSKLKRDAAMKKIQSRLSHAFVRSIKAVKTGAEAANAVVYAKQVAYEERERQQQQLQQSSTISNLRDLHAMSVDDSDDESEKAKEHKEDDDDCCSSCSSSEEFESRPLSPDEQRHEEELQKQAQLAALYAEAHRAAREREMVAQRWARERAMLEQAKFQSKLLESQSTSFNVQSLPSSDTACRQQ